MTDKFTPPDVLHLSSEEMQEGRVEWFGGADRPVECDVTYWRAGSNYPDAAPYQAAFRAGRMAGFLAAVRAIDDFIDNTPSMNRIERSLILTLLKEMDKARPMRGDAEGGA